MAVGPAFDPENIWSFELGSKGRIAGGLLNYTVAGYYYKYDDLQVLVQVPGIPAPITQNAGASEGYGVELQVDAEPVDGLRLIGGLALGNAEFTDFITADGTDNSGNALVRSPDFTGSFIADYRTEIGTSGTGFFARGEYSYRSQVFFRPENGSETRQGGYSLFNASAGMTFGDGQFELGGFVQNLFDEEFLVDTSIVIPGLVEYTQRGLPRTSGISLRARY